MTHDLDRQAAECITEIEQLHAWFSAWFAGEYPAASIGRFERALSPDFCLIDASGKRFDREAIVDAVASGRGARLVDISIRDAVMLWQRGHLTAISYIEHQEAPDSVTDRRSTAVFEHGPSGPRWLSVHETWMEQSDD